MRERAMGRCNRTDREIIPEEEEAEEGDEEEEEQDTPSRPMDLHPTLNSKESTRMSLILRHILSKRRRVMKKWREKKRKLSSTKTGLSKGKKKREMDSLMISVTPLLRPKE